MIHYIICLATIFFAHVLCAQQYDGHFSVVPQNRLRDNNLGRYAPRDDPSADPFVQKLCSEHAESWALHEQAQLLLRQQASWEVLPPDFVENFKDMSWWESHVWSHGRDDYAARWNNFIAEKSEMQTLSPVQRQAYEREAMRQWRFYQHPEFRLFIKRLSTYDVYIAEIARQYVSDADFAQALERLPIDDGWKNFFETELRALQCKKLEDELKFKKFIEARQVARLQEQHSAMRRVYDAQSAEVAEAASEWNLSHPARAAAYQQALVAQGCVDQRSYSFSEAAQALLQTEGYSHNTCTQFVGNALQHQLQREIVTGIDALAALQLPPTNRVYLAKTMQQKTVGVLIVAQKTNTEGRCAASAELIDFGISLTKYLEAIARGLWDGTGGAVGSTVHMVLHPCDTVHHLALSVAQLIHFLPPAYEHFDNLTQHSNSLELYEAECDRIAHNWGLACDQVTGPLLVQLATAVLVTTLTNSVIARCAPALVGALAQRGAAVAQAVRVRYPLAAYLTHAAVRTYAATAKAVKRGVKVTAARVERLLTHYMRIPESAPLLATAEGVIIPAGGMRHSGAQRILLFSESVTELPRPNIIRGSAAVEEAAAIIPAHHGLLTTSAEVAAEMQRIKSVPYEVLVDRITETGVQLGYSRTSIMQAIENFKNPSINVTIDMFGEGIFRFRDIPGGEEVIHNVFKNMIMPNNCNRANGALYELAEGSVFEIAENEKMLELAKHIFNTITGKDNEHDFMTVNYLGECKNVYWKNFIGDEDSCNKLIKQLTVLEKNAKILLKKPVFVTRHPIPENLGTIPQLLIDLKIAIIIGY